MLVKKFPQAIIKILTVLPVVDALRVYGKGFLQNKKLVIELRQYK